MNKKLLLSIFLGLGLASTAQTIPNGGMETWTSNGLYSEPNGWGTSNVSIIFGADVSAEQSSDMHAGTSSAKLTTVEATVQGNDLIIPGTIYFGSFDAQTFTLDQGMQWNERTDSIVLWYKYMPNGNDQGAVVGSLTHWDSQAGTQEMIATITGTIDAASSWTRLALPFQYGGSSSTPDTISLMIGSSGETGGTPGSIMYVDDISSVKNAPLSLPKEAKEVAISVYPSPSDDHVTISMAKEATVEIYNALGQRVYSTRAASKSLSISTDDFVNGVYMVRTSSGLTQRFVVKH